MARLGEILREQRERRGILLVGAANDTRIRENFLNALEQGDYNLLPGAVYTKGFLRKYAEYLDLDPSELVGLYNEERGVAAEPVRAFRPMRPITHRSVILTPSVLVPAFVLAGVFLFVGYLYYQFTVFAVPPRIEVMDPSTDAITQAPEYMVRGRTVPDGRVTVRVFPGPETFTDIRPASDGSFSVRVALKPGPNHVEVEVLDQAGKVSRETRSIMLEQQATVANQAPQLILEQPANGGAFTNAPVTVSGRVARVSSVVVNGTPVTVGADGRFTVTVSFTAGQQTIRVVARTATGGEVQETRTVSVGYTAAFVTVTIKGGSAWILATVDGAQVASTNRVFPDGQVLTFSGSDVRVRTGNAAATHLSFTGQDLGVMGTPGLVTERAFASP